jgi:tRNA dimethylallyltransferase
MDLSEKIYPKVVVLVGPTASGKTNWAIRLAKKFNGEIISADSRQIYKKMDIGTAKEPGEWRRDGLHKTYYVEDVPHHLIGFLDPGKTFTLAEFRDKAMKYCEQIIKNGKVPIVAGGTGLYIHGLVDNLQIPKVAPNDKLRKSLEEKSNEELVKWLASLDPQSAETVDHNNKRRLIRALEVCILSGTPFSQQQQHGEKVFDFLQIGIEVPREILYQRIDKRVQNMFDRGLLKEVEALMRQKYSWELPSMSGIGYRQFKDYFAKQISLDEVKENLQRDTRHYAKRQLTWFKRDERVNWLSEYEEAEKLVGEFLK